MTMNDTRGLWRGKRVDNGEWVKGDLSRMGEQRFIAGKDHWKFAVDLSTLGECTGLRDKNGKFIFEGDILMGDIPEDLPNNRNLIGVVRYERTAYMVDFSHSREKWKIQRVGFCSFSNFEVIGNIHDGGVKCD